MADTKTIAFILELDNAKGREREETLSFLRNLMKRVVGLSSDSAEVPLSDDNRL